LYRESGFPKFAITFPDRPHSNRALDFEYTCIVSEHFFSSYELSAYALDCDDVHQIEPIRKLSIITSPHSLDIDRSNINRVRLFHSSIECYEAPAKALDSDDVHHVRTKFHLGAISPPNSLDFCRCVGFSDNSMNKILGNETPTNALNSDDAHQIIPETDHAAVSTPRLLDFYCCTLHMELIPCYDTSAESLDGEDAK
jgi:hypothetical protein